MKRIFTILLFSFCFLHLSNAQIQAPDFLCVRVDTLIWNLPVNNCGPFVSYDIFASQDINGPYTLLDSVTDPSQDFYFHPNPGAQQWYYYMVSNHDCPGEIQLSSDTLDNRPPEVSPIRSASVENGLVQLDWYPSPSPETFAYIIYRQIPTGVVPVDTVFNATTYLDLNSSPDTQPESYFVNALDPCGNASIFDLKHTTMFVQGESVPCEQVISLNWNAYEEWPNGIENQEVWVGENGAPPSLFTTIDGSATTFDYPVDTDSSTYCFYITAIEAVTGAAARSNEFCIMADIIKPADDTFIRSVSVLPDNTVDIAWNWNTQAEITTVEILRSGQNANYEVISSQGVQLPVPASDTYIDMDTDPSAGNFYYRIQAIDNCGDATQSTYGSTIFLDANVLTDNTNQIAWTAMDIENAVPDAYDIYKITATGQETSIATVAGNINLYEDTFDPLNPDEVESCYYVIGKAVLTTPDGAQLSTQSRSNTGCVEQDVRIQVPNAFAPEGFNQEFRPLLTFGEMVEYELRIFDRYGKQLFISNAPEDGWRGKSDGKKLPQGVYVYYIKVTQSSGKEVERKGTVLLIR